jgi:hypothetical protein
MNIKTIAQSRTLRGIIIGIGLFVVVILIFQAGVFVGYRKADFSYRFGDNYSNTFGSGRSGMMNGFPQDMFIGGHGAVGKIIRINLPTIVVADQGNVEKVINISDDTVVRRFRDTVKPADLKVDDFIVVLGQPDDKGQIDAKLIRIMPSPAIGSAAPSSTNPQ